MAPRLAGRKRTSLRLCAGDRTPYQPTAMTGQTATLSAGDRAKIDQLRALVAARQWLVVHTPQESLAHTIGLTAFRLPELVVTRPCLNCDIGTQLDRWAARFVAGELEMGVLIRVHDLQLREHTFHTRGYDIESRGGLLLARALYRRLVAYEIDIASCRCVPCRAGLYRTVPDRAGGADRA